MYINRVFETVKTLANTDGRGNFKPSDFDLALYNTILERYDAYLIEINQMVNREGRGLINGGLENIPDRIREKLLHYLVPSASINKTSGYYLLPTDLRYFDTIINASVGNKEESFEPCKSMEEFNIIKSLNATTKYPIYIKTANGIKTAPDSFTAISIYYLRNPKFPKWTYALFGGNEMFNPSAPDFQDIDMHPSEEADLIRGVCLKMGINLKEPDLQAAMQNQDQIEFNRNNAT